VSENFVLIGPGRVGISLSYVLKNKGFSLLGVIGRSKERIDYACKLLDAKAVDNFESHIFKKAEVVLITTPDDAILNVACKLRALYPELLLVHTSGLHPSHILGDGPRLSLHPLQSFADVKEALKNLPGSFFSLEGDEKGLEWGKKVVEMLNGEWVIISSEQKPLYHLSACIASNFLVTLFYFALKGMQEAGIEKDKVKKGLLALVDGTIKNIKSFGVPNALTGPIVRGDVGTIERHLEVLREKSGLREIYLQLALFTVKMLEEKKDFKSQLDQIKKLILQHLE